MTYRATPNTGYSPFFLLHGRQVSPPINDDLKAKVSNSDLDLNRWIEKLKDSLRSAYKSVRAAKEGPMKTIRSIMIAELKGVNLI